MYSDYCFKFHNANKNVSVAHSRQIWWRRSNGGVPMALCHVSHRTCSGTRTSTTKHDDKRVKQECIPVGCVLPASSTTKHDDKHVKNAFFN